MNIFIQIALGMIPAIILFLVLSLTGKKHKIRNIAMLSMFTLILASSIVGNIIYDPVDDSIASGDDVSVRLDLIYAVADEDVGLSIATNLMRSLRSDSLLNAEFTECDALLHAESGDFYAAKALISKAEQLMNIGYSARLKELCDACIAESKIDHAASSYLGNTESGTPGKAVEELKSFASEILKQKVSDGDETVKKAAKVLVDSENLYSLYLHSDTLDEESLEKLTRRIKSAIEENPELLSIPQVRLCRLKLLVLGGDYKDIAELIDDNASYEELAITSELYINKLVKESHFSEDFSEDSVEIYEKVADQVEKVIDKIPEENVTEMRKADELADSLKNASKAPALYKMKDSLATYAADESFTDRPKAYLQLARVEYSTGSENRAQDYITESLGTVGICEDDDFTVPMAGIVDSITDKDDPEKLKNVAEYVDEVTASTADVVVSKAVNNAKIESGSSEEPDGGEKNDGQFGSFMADYVSQKRVSFNITNIDATDFETVRATISVDDSVSITADELKAMINLKDCGTDITDFTVEKVEYKGANILLCCDVSGSMSGKPIADLRTAVTLFADTATDVERLALVTFESYVRDTWDFGTPNETISSAGSSLTANGGTNMYDAIIESIGKFSLKEGELNFILLLSDGADSTNHPSDEIMENIGLPARDKGIILYSLGLGDSVNTDYMNTLAASTGGSFLYVNDSTSLSSFYDYLRGQILNQYIITFKAEDTLTVDRELSISLKDDPLTGDIGYYNLRGEGEEGEYAPSELIGLEEKGIYGLDTRLVYRSSKAVSVTLSGFGFAETDSFSITLDGDLDYSGSSVSVAYADENTLNVLLPGGMACGSYDVRVSVNGKTAILDNELTVVAQGQEKTTAFGPYVFTSYQKTEQEGSVSLSGYVTMNGWLNFNGEVILEGDLNGQAINMTDYHGSYIKYYTDTATGLAGYLAKRNSVLNFPAFGTLTLYNDSFNDPESDNYRVEAKPTSILTLGSMLSLNAAGLELYPNRLEVKSDSFSTKFPLQETLLKAGGLDKLFTFNITADGVITNKTIGVRVDMDNKGDSDIYNPVNLGSMPIYVSPASYKIHIDTVANEYSIEYSTKVAFINSEGIGFLVEWKERDTDSGLEKLWPSTVMLMSDTKIKASIGTVPVTYRDFKLGAEDIDPNASVFDWMFVGSFDLESVKVSDYLPGLDKWIDDPAILKLDDTTLKFSIGQAYISIETKLQLLEQIDLAKAKIEAGRIPFTNIMLGINNEEANGLRAALTVGIMWKTDNCDIDLSGTAELSAHSRFTGVEVIGKCNLSVDWWLFESSTYAEGRAILGMYKDHQNRLNFIIKARSNSADGVSGKEYYIYWNDDSGFEFEKKTY